MSSPASIGMAALPPEVAACYHQAMRALQGARVSFLVGGAYAFERYTGIARYTKDFDVFIREADLDRALTALAGVGYRTEVTFPHWLAKAFSGEDFIDVIFRSGNGVSRVDDTWFRRAVETEVLGVPVLLCPVEEIILTKAFIMERERFDGADVAHLLHAEAERLDWAHLLRRFGPHWRVLLAHLVLFGFIYPSERERIPQSVMQELLQKLQAEAQTPSPTDPICYGTLLSREQYLVDVERWHYQDARLRPRGGMTSQQIAEWTGAIDEEGENAGS